MKKYQALRQRYPRFIYQSYKWQIDNRQLHIQWQFQTQAKTGRHLHFRPTLTIPLPTETITPGQQTPINLSAYLVPLGGGKDSIVTLELIKQIYNLKSRIYNPVYAFAINPTDAIKQTAQIAHVPLISVKRQLDPAMLKLNDQGFLNGHTPFSALVAFVSTLVAKLYKLNNIALSNESSANEPTLFWQGHPINHQYSKSLQFESSFRDYLASSATDIKDLAFYIGLVEMLSYWKLTASPEIVIQAGKLNQAQLKFWQELLLNGLGEYFYINQIPFWEKGFIKWQIKESIKGIKAKTPAAQMRSTSSSVRLALKSESDRELAEQMSSGQDISNYFSFLRPLHELQIARLFAQIGKPYFQVFRSCNVGQKQGVWCNACPKCLFAFCMIFPFVGEAQALEIWGENLLEKKSLLQTAYQLIGAKVDDKQNVKPFECVGTKLESLAAFWLATKWYRKQKQPLPYILGQFQKNIFPQHQDLDKKAQEILDSFDERNHLPKKLEAFLAKNIQNPSKSDQEFVKQTSGRRSVNFPLLDYLIFGLGREGRSTFHFLMRQGISPTQIILVDDKPVSKLSSQWQEVIDRYSLQVLTSTQILNSKFKIQNLKLIKSPGIPCSHPLIKWAQQRHIPITSNTQMFFETVRGLHDNKPAAWMQSGNKSVGVALTKKPDREFAQQTSSRQAKIIGVTGTKGKSTTSALIAHILKKAGFNIKLGGNLGTPPLELIKNEKLKIKNNDDKTEVDSERYSLKPNKLRESHESTAWTKSTNESVGVALTKKPDRKFAKQTSNRQKINLPPIYILELSSHQLASLDQSPDIAVWLNLYPEHLDYYDDINEYAQTKSHIFKHQRHQDHLIYNADDPIVAKFAQKAHSHLVPLTFKEAEKIDLTQTRLIGRHNQFNLLAAVKVAELFDVDPKTTLKLAGDFTPLPHRLEKVAEIDEVSYINDSLATNPTATIKAIEAFKNKSIILIAGGFDRGLDYTSLAEAIKLNSNIKAVILLPDTGAKIQKLLTNDKKNNTSQDTSQKPTHHQSATTIFIPPTHLVANLSQAVKLAKSLTQPGDVVLLSPAAASFNQFKSYRHRGETFKQLVVDSQSF